MIDEQQRDMLDLVLANAFENHTVIRMSSRRIPSCPRFLALDDEVYILFFFWREISFLFIAFFLQLEDYNSDQNSSTMSQITATTDVIYNAIPMNNMIELNNYSHLSRYANNDIYTLVPMNLLSDSYSTD